MKVKNCFSAMVCALLSATNAVNAESITLEKIIVTAQKREEGIQSVAASISAVSGNAFELRGFEDPRDLAKFVPICSKLVSGLDLVIWVPRHN